MADLQANHDLQPGDLCHHGSNALPLYRVIWIDDGRVWLRDVNNGMDSVVHLDRCHACATEVAEALEPVEAPMPAGVTWPDGTPRP